MLSSLEKKLQPTQKESPHLHYQVTTVPGLEPWSPESQCQEGANREYQRHRLIPYSDFSFTLPALRYSFIEYFLSLYLVIILTTCQCPCPIYSYPPSSQSWICIPHPTESGLLSLGTGDRGQQKSRASSGAALTRRPSLSLSLCSNSFTLCPSRPCSAQAGGSFCFPQPHPQRHCLSSWSFTNLL